VPAFYSSNYYVQLSASIVLLANAAYYTKYPYNPAQVFRHHLFQLYHYLAEQLPCVR
jgi:hypothetical protein